MEVAVVDEAFPVMSASSAVYPTARVVGDILYVAYRLPGESASAVVSFTDVERWGYGEPNDEGLRTHPLWGRGLAFYAFHRVDPESRRGRWRWIGTFHDGTFEVVAGGRAIVARRRTGEDPKQALDALRGPGSNRVLDDER